jgi:hypothetical protein
MIPRMEKSPASGKKRKMDGSPGVSWYPVASPPLPFCLMAPEENSPPERTLFFNTAMQKDKNDTTISARLSERHDRKLYSPPGLVRWRKQGKAHRGFVYGTKLLLSMHGFYGPIQIGWLQGVQIVSVTAPKTFMIRELDNDLLLF